MPRIVAPRVPRIVGPHRTRMGESCRRIHSPLFARRVQRFVARPVPRVVAPRVQRIVGALVYNNCIIQ